MNRVAETAYIGLGSNLGDRLLYLSDALEMLDKAGGVSVTKKSPVYETKPVGVTDQPKFLNCAVQVQTTLTPDELLVVCRAIEEKLERVRITKWGPRTIDLDILFYGNKVINEKMLKIPHPRIQDRGFVLKPLMDIAPDLIHPVFKSTIKELYFQFTENSDEGKDIILYEGDMH